MDQNLIDKIDELTKRNTEYMRNTNVTLNHIRGGITKSIKNTEEEAYNRGANDAWEIAKKVTTTVVECYMADEMRAIFDKRTASGVMVNYTGVEAIEAVKKYEEKQKAQSTVTEFKRGDVVIVGNLSRTGIYASEDDEYYYVWLNGDYHIALLNKQVYKITKTGKHIDLDI